MAAKTKEEKEQEKPKNFKEELAALKKDFEINNNREKVFLSSGSLALDLALDEFGRGWQLGRQAELKAWEGSGKTSVCLHTIAEAQKRKKIDPTFNYAYVDAEHSLNPEYARTIGVDWEDFQESLFSADNGEQAFEFAKRLIRTGELRLIIFDSTSGMKTRKEMEDEAGTSHLGLHARLFSDQVPALKALADKYNCLLIYVSQIREKIGVMFGSPETTQAGNALKFFDDYRIELRRDVLKENGDKEDPTGIRSRFNITKNKAFKPYITGEFYINVGEGIDKIRELVDIAVSLDIINRSGSWYSYGDSKIGQGFTNVKTFLQDNPEMAEEIKMFFGIPTDPYGEYGYKWNEFLDREISKLGGYTTFDAFGFWNKKKELTKLVIIEDIYNDYTLRQRINDICIKYCEQFDQEYVLVTYTPVETQLYGKTSRE